MMTEQKYTLNAPTAVIGKNGLATAAGWLTVYNSSAQNGEYTGASVEYIPVGVGLPAGGHQDAPQLPADSSLAIQRQGSAWQLVADHRGKTAFFIQTGQSVIISQIGELDAALTFLAPATPFDSWDGQKWVTDEDAQHRSQVETAQEELARRTTAATTAIAPLQDAVDTEIATDAEQAALLAWKKYRVALSRIDADTAPDIAWPELP
ncbi:tail fiber assembly protein [Serratia sp. root2]|uniref:tail fiber assembly protein n=1 Tax=Serratia sp. root2 TaxID=3059676 RepID=UPI00288D9CE7|nr:tail fiber assembly protein [Serratia sp. root2]MDT3252746.1 tail fiber assembly protein [Serratia sp. root2]